MTSKQIKGIRSALDLKQRQFADALGVTQQSVWNWEHGVAPGALYAAFLELMLEALKTPDGRAELAKVMAETRTAKSWSKSAGVQASDCGAAILIRGVAGLPTRSTASSKR